MLDNQCSAYPLLSIKMQAWHRGYTENQMGGVIRIAPAYAMGTAKNWISLDRDMKLTDISHHLMTCR